MNSQKHLNGKSYIQGSDSRILAAEIYTQYDETVAVRLYVSSNATESPVFSILEPNQAKELGMRLIYAAEEVARRNDYQKGEE